MDNYDKEDFAKKLANSTFLFRRNSLNCLINLLCIDRRHANWKENTLKNFKGGAVEEWADRVTMISN